MYNINTKTFEKAHRLAQVAADDMIDVTEVRTGDIAAVFGLKYPLCIVLSYILVYFI